MPFDEKLAIRVRRVLDRRSDLEEKQMFGGLAFMIRGHMAVGILRSTLMVRVDAADQDELLDEPHTRPMDFTGRPMRGFLYVDPPGIATAPALKKWIAHGVRYAESRPVKTRVLKRRPPRARRPR
jgi:TfoX/Sxy family transcriptional regulator of competence genes